MFEVIITKEELYDKCENMEQLYDKFYYPLLVEYKELKKQLEDLFSENRNLRKKLENCMTFEDYKYTLNKKIKLDTQQKEFIKYLEDDLKEKYRDMGYRHNIFREILQKYKSIIGVSDDNKTDV